MLFFIYFFLSLFIYLFIFIKPSQCTDKYIVKVLSTKEKSLSNTLNKNHPFMCPLTKSQYPVYGPDAWGNVASACRQADQSPIDIVTKKVESDSSLGELDITCDNDKGLFNGILLNNGHEPVLTADNERGTCNLTGIALDNKNFELHDLNIHFGCDTDKGSEHTVDGKPFPAEVRVDMILTRYQYHPTCGPIQILHFNWLCY